MIFERYDLSGDGSIGPKELRGMCASMGKTLSDAELAEAMAQLDVDGSGQVGFDEFYAWWKAGLSKETLLDHTLDRNTAKRGNGFTCSVSFTYAGVANKPMRRKELRQMELTREANLASNDQGEKSSLERARKATMKGLPPPRTLQKSSGTRGAFRGKSGKLPSEWAGVAPPGLTPSEGEGPLGDADGSGPS